MYVNKTGTRLLAVTLSLSLVGAGAPNLAGAAIVGTQQALVEQAPSAHGARVEAFLARDEVARELARQGVDPALVQERIAALSDQELARLAGEIDGLPAGAGVIEVVGIVFIVLLILELVGVTNVFSGF